MSPYRSNACSVPPSGSFRNRVASAIVSSVPGPAGSLPSSATIGREITDGAPKGKCRGRLRTPERRRRTSGRDGAPDRQDAERLQVSHAGGEDCRAPEGRAVAAAVPVEPGLAPMTPERVRMPGRDEPIPATGDDQH